MTRDVHTINEKQTVGELIEMLEKESIHGAPVVDGKGKVLGVVSVTDLVHAEASDMRQPGFFCADAVCPMIESDFAELLYRRVSDLMSTGLIVNKADDSLETAAQTMVDYRVHRVLVLDEEGKLEGILSALDILKALLAVQSSESLVRTWGVA